METEKKSEYEIQGENFLEESSVKMKARFLKCDIYFQGDKESRDIFRITFERDKRYGHPEWNKKQKSFSFTFGQSINDSTGNGDNSPSAYTVIAGLTKYDPRTFENFCSEFGYDIDSRTAEKTYKSVVKEWKKVNAFFTQAELEKMQEIQ